jgi:hypothetical protein
MDVFESKQDLFGQREGRPPDLPGLGKEHEVGPTQRGDSIHLPGIAPAISRLSVASARLIAATKAS